MNESARQKIVPADLDDCIKFVEEHREEIARGLYDLHLEKEWAKALASDDLLQLARNCPAARLAIASVTKSPELLETLARDAADEVREAVADNPRATASILALLSSDSTPAVRMAVASNNNTSTVQLDALARDAVNYVRWGVAHNEKTTPETVELLIKDPERHVSDEAKKNPNAPKKGFFARLFKKG
jgi:hypothetical protein